MRDFELAANATSEVVLDFAMTGNRRPSAGGWIFPNRMGPTLPFEQTSVLTQVTLQVNELHDAGISRASRTERGELSCRAFW